MQLKISIDKHVIFPFAILILSGQIAITMGCNAQTIAYVFVPF